MNKYCIFAEVLQDTTQPRPGLSSAIARSVGSPIQSISLLYRLPLPYPNTKLEPNKNVLALKSNYFTETPTFISHETCLYFERFVQRYLKSRSLDDKCQSGPATYHL